MKTTQETADLLQGVFDRWVESRLSAEPWDIVMAHLGALLDDRDELARLREGLRKEVSEWRQAGRNFSGDPLGDMAHRIANRLEILLNNGDGDGNQ